MGELAPVVANDLAADQHRRDYGAADGSHLLADIFHLGAEGGEFLLRRLEALDELAVISEELDKGLASPNCTGVSHYLYVRLARASVGLRYYAR